MYAILFFKKKNCKLKDNGCLFVFQIEALVPLTKHVMQLKYRKKASYQGYHLHTQCVIYAFVTSYARITMLEIIRRLQQRRNLRIMYMDTGTYRYTGTYVYVVLYPYIHNTNFAFLFPIPIDSLILTLPDDPTYREELVREFGIGKDAFGKFKNECPSDPIHYCSLGKKNYAIVCNNGDTITRVRGFSLTNKRAQTAINYNTMKDLLFKSLENINKTIEVKNFSFLLNLEDQIIATRPITKKSSNSNPMKRWLNKSNPDAYLSTFPYGCTSFNFEDLL